MGYIEEQFIRLGSLSSKKNKSFSVKITSCEGNTNFIGVSKQGVEKIQKILEEEEKNKKIEPI